MQKTGREFIAVVWRQFCVNLTRDYDFINTGRRLLQAALDMQKKCSNCRLVNFADADDCARCGAALVPSADDKPPPRFFQRVVVCMLVCLTVLAGFYLSLIASAKSVSYEDKKVVHRAIGILKEKGFKDEVFLLENLAAFRASDNWLNASVSKEDAYAATNFPFEIVTVYPDFFTYPQDDTERAAILLHEARHLAGKDEHDAYEFVWKNRKQLGWTDDAYRNSPVWQNIRKQTKDNVPMIFVCDHNEFSDCTQ